VRVGDLVIRRLTSEALPHDLARMSSFGKVILNQAECDSLDTGGLGTICFDVWIVGKHTPHYGLATRKLLLMPFGVVRDRHLLLDHPRNVGAVLGVICVAELQAMHSRTEGIFILVGHRGFLFAGCE
jgi:hypothetical protein